MRRRTILFAALLGAAFAGSAVAQVASAPAAPAAPAATSTAEIDRSDYLLGPSDKIRVIVFGETDLSGEFIIPPSGRLAFPLIGEIDARGQNVGQLQNAIATRLKDGYLRDPRVSIEVLTFRPFYILGEVNKPGEYPFTAGLTVMKAVATAQGFTYRANTRRVLIKHAGQDKEQPYSVDESTPVAPGDVVRVRERYF